MDSYFKKAVELKSLFLSTNSTETHYKKIIEMGEKLPIMPSLYKVESSVVKGCQSILYLHGEFKEGKIFFQADSNALISKGLAALLIYLYNGESPQIILQSPPTVLLELKIQSLLSQNRANGFTSIYKKIKTIAITYAIMYTQEVK